MISPWVSFSFTDLLQSRRWLRMTATQQAIYINLLGAQATTGPLPEDPEEFAWIATRNTEGLTEDDFRAAWVPPLTLCFESAEQGGIVNPRMAKEIELASERSARGRAAARARWKDRDARALKAQSESSANPLPDRTEQNSQALTPLPPEGGIVDNFGAADLVNLVVSTCPKGRLGRGGEERRAVWAREWQWTGHPAGSGALALERYRASQDDSLRTPTVPELVAHTQQLLRDAEVGIPPLSLVVDRSVVWPGSAEILERIGVSLGDRVKTWPVGAGDNWTRHAARAQLATAWNRHHLNPNRQK